MRANIGRFFTLVFVSVLLLGLGSCQKAKDAGSVVKDKAVLAKDKVVDVAGNVSDRSGKGNLVAHITAPGGAILSITDGRVKDPYSGERKDTFQLPADIELPVPAVISFKITDGQIAVYGKMETFQETPFTEVGKVEIKLNSTVLANANSGKVQFKTFKDPNSDVELVKISMGNRP